MRPIESRTRLSHNCTGGEARAYIDALQDGITSLAVILMAYSTSKSTLRGLAVLFTESTARNSAR
jgi:hypothetical protein